MPRGVRSAGFAGALALTVSSLGARVSAVAAPTLAGSRAEVPFDFVGIGYLDYIRAGGIETQIDIPADTDQDIGYSDVELTHDPGQAEGHSKSAAATYWLGQYADEGLLGCGKCPPDAGDRDSGADPLTTRRIQPDQGGGWGRRDPHLQDPYGGGEKIAPVPADGTPILAHADSPDGLHGSATGQAVNIGGPDGIGSAGSTTVAAIEKSTGVYTATSRAYVSGIHRAGTLDTIESLLQITQRPPTSPTVTNEPTITYRLSFLDSAGAANLAGNGFTLAGHDLPAAELLAQFNQQAAANAAAIDAIGPLGFRLLAPQAGLTRGGEEIPPDLPYLIAPAIQANLGLNARKAGIGENQYVRLASSLWAGVYGQAPVNPPTGHPK
jgi:hypothetical protein